MRYLPLLILLLGGAARAMPAQTWVVAIGHNRGDAEEVTLRFAERDAAELADAMRQLGGVQPERIVTLLGEDAGGVRRALRAVQGRLGGASDAALVVFYSGHADAHALHLGGTQLPIEEITALVGAAPAPLRVLILDACRSGSASRVKGMKPGRSFEIRASDRVQAEGLAIITSSTAGEDSQESDALRGSFFSHHLVGGLRGAADRDGDDKVTLAEAYAYAYAQTLRSSGRTMTLQHPTYRFDLKGQGEVVLTRRDVAGHRAGLLQLGPPALYLIFEEREGGAVAAEVAPPRADVTLALPPRRYFVQQRDPREYRHYQIEVRRGQTTRLQDHAYRTVRYDRLVRSRGAPIRSVHGLLAMAGARGGLLDGEGVAPQAVLGYQADLPWLSVGARLRFSSVDSAGGDAESGRRHEEYAAAVLLERFVDLPWLSASFGVLIEGTVHRQVFTGGRAIDARGTIGVAFGAFLALERHLPAGLALRVEGGPCSALLQTTTVAEGVATGTALATPVTWWTAAGLKWRL
jgi:hypothetical protein